MRRLNKTIGAAATPIKCFAAARRGSSAQQAVGFTSIYRLRGAAMNDNNYDLSMGTGILTANGVYMIYAC